MAHRIIWKMQTGEDPPIDIDHSDRNGLNNRWNNLRLATKSQNGFNKPPRARRDNLPRGVYRYTNKHGIWWKVFFQIDKVRKTYYLGPDLDLACLLAEEIVAKYHGEFRCDHRAVTGTEKIYSQENLEALSSEAVPAKVKFVDTLTPDELKKFYTDRALKMWETRRRKATSVI